MLFKRTKRTLSTMFIMGALQLLIVGGLIYAGYRYVRTSVQKNLPKQIDNIASSYQEIIGEPLPEEAQATLNRINDFFKPSASNSLKDAHLSRSLPNESFDTIPSHPFYTSETTTQALSPPLEKNVSLQEWVNQVPVASLVLSESGKNRANIDGKTYRQGEIINPLYQLKWTQSRKSSNGSVRLYFITPDGSVYIRDF